MRIGGSVRWPVVRLIFGREVRDQMRDRRTLFMIFVLPVLLYPILILGLTQLATAFQQRLRLVAIVGREWLPEAPPLLAPSGETFDASLFDNPAEAQQYRLPDVLPDSPLRRPEGRREAVRERRVDVVVVVPEDARELAADEARAFQPGLIYDSVDERSRDTARAVREVFARWGERIVQERLRRDEKPENYLQPVQPESVDVARKRSQGVGVWARVFPYLLVMMALTGAFYPAIDLCAGEKERGTMETLLITPATRGEIVLGKFLTVAVASLTTAVLNLASMGLTAWRVSAQFGGAKMAGGAGLPIAPPSWEAAFWMLLMLVPLAVFFAALCVALAAMARSMKEGQYYLSPLYIAALPLVLVTMAPGVELGLFTSLVPVTGVSLLLRALMLGQYVEARTYFLPVLLPMAVYGWLALRWAVAQFRREEVLFREAERFELKSWLIHLHRDREPTPSGGQALLAFVLMLVLAVLGTGAMGSSWRGMVAGQLAFVLGPPLLMTLLLTSSPRATLRLRWPALGDVLLAAGLALAVHPLAAELRQVVEWAFPIPEAVKAPLARMMAGIPDYGVALVVLALVPAVCEELAFRGFILSGLERNNSPAGAVVLSAVLFGLLHVLLSLFAQLFNATLLGLVLGLLALRAGSIVPGIVFHAINNGLALVAGAVSAGEVGGRLAGVLYRNPKEGLFYYGWDVVGGLVFAGLLWVLLRPRERGLAGEAAREEPAMAASGGP